MRNGVSVSGMGLPSGTRSDCAAPGELGNCRFRAVEEEEGIERSVVVNSYSPREKGIERSVVVNSDSPRERESTREREREREIERD